MRFLATLFLMLIFLFISINAEVQVPLTFQTSESPESTGVFEIQVQTSSDSLFTDILEESPWMNCKENSQFTYNATFPDNISLATYWWRARHDNGILVSDWSQSYYFTLSVASQLLVSLQPAYQMDYSGDTDTLWINLSDSVTNLVGAYFKIIYEDSFLTPLGVIKGPVLNPPDNFFLSCDIYPDSILINLASLGKSFSDLGSILGITLRAENEIDSTKISFERSVLRDSINQNIPHSTLGAVIVIKAVDTLPSPVPSDFIALAGNQKCRLSWNNPAGDPTFMGVEIRRNPWHTDAYPEYDDKYSSPLGYPSNQNEGTLVYRGNAKNFVDSIMTPRNVYYYSIFSYDSSGNYSSPDTGRALNYWLGDVTGDGQVYFEDLVIFAETFGEVAGGSNYVAEFDIGPTYDMTSTGIPTTDNSIDFEDLVIFALNYMEVGNQKIAGRELARAASGELGLSLSLPAEKIKLQSNFEVSISLVNNLDIVKSIHFVIPYDSSVLEFVSISRSYELIDSSYTLFFYGKDVEHKVDVSLAVLGGSTPITGSGEIAVVTFKLVKNVTPNLTFSLIDLRDGSGNTLDAEENYEYTETGEHPRTYNLNQNFPNPFNPVTTIPFSLKAADLNFYGYIPASLKIYNIKGQLVKTLFEEEKLAGNYSIIWDGKDNSGNEVASGIYFYRLKASEYFETRKMILIR